MPIMNHTHPIHVVAATRKGDRQILPDLNQIGVGDVINPGNQLISHEIGEDSSGNEIQTVPCLDGVNGSVAGDSGAVVAGAREGDFGGLSGGDGGVGGGGEWERVGSEDVAEVLDAEEGFDVGVGGGVDGYVVD